MQSVHDSKSGQQTSKIEITSTGLSLVTNTYSTLNSLNQQAYKHKGRRIQNGLDGNVGIVRQDYETTKVDDEFLSAT
ncbi:unnamed protein product [Cylindrotheca closterium]|uniref:Uncharacterized protein n=1 Tax=Cylindrotheca closterium TaxID=2856 RepID=A0AAD2G3G7_9STRA|nr:unnamed protein product [Cylindrotheca closterium]